jgi:hypothetical protein
VSAELAAPDSVDALYLARGDEVSLRRPTFTGDVFVSTNAGLGGSDSQPAMFVIVQYPCALRTNGIHRVRRVLVAEVEPRAPLTLREWNGSYRIMPLPSLRPESVDSGHYCAAFQNLLVVTPEELDQSERNACLSDVGVNLLLQRWVHHNSRAIVQTRVFEELTARPLAEAEIMEDWVTSRQMLAMPPGKAEAECHAFLRTVPDGDNLTRQKALENSRRRAELRRAVRTHLNVAPPTT